MLDKNKVKLGIAPIAWTNLHIAKRESFFECGYVVSRILVADFAAGKAGERCRNRLS